MVKACHSCAEGATQLWNSGSCKAGAQEHRSSLADLVGLAMVGVLAARKWHEIAFQ